MSRALHCKVEFDVRAEQMEFIISSHVKRELYFIIQEVAQNTLKHAFANLLTIKLSWENGLQVIIQDDGQGLLPLGMGKGFGLASIQNRAHAIGAQMSMHNTTPGLIVILEYQQLQ
ncbi:MAG: hypothetical protein MUE95_01710 [Cyclobacteriaceae bacterium]|nr:hypothetical protein [Cyclobacteriaceae bacterium]